jgi:hypothetical protein
MSNGGVLKESESRGAFARVNTTLTWARAFTAAEAEARSHYIMLHADSAIVIPDVCADC